MGYNGGTNKRGYYRRNHGMYSKSSYKSGEKILTNTILGGLGLLAAAGSAIIDAADNLPTSGDTAAKHFSPKTQRTIIIIGGIIALLCPIGGFLVFAYIDWWMIFSVLVFGSIETFIITGITTSAGSKLHDKDYIYEEELENVTKECKTNRKILIALFITLFILNLYPIALFALHSIELSNNIYIPINTWDGGETSIPFIFVVIKLLLNGGFILEIFHNNIIVENYKVIRKRKEVKNNSTKTSKTEKDSSTSSDDPIHHTSESRSTQTESNSNRDILDISEEVKIPKINGSYMEDFWKPYGTLQIYATYATIGFSFPGPDQRYKNTYFSISENEIDKYIHAYEKNWEVAEKLLEQTQSIPNTELKQKGEMNMDIVVRNKQASVYLYSYHLPLNSKKECYEMITALRRAKIRIKQVRERLFTQDK